MSQEANLIRIKEPYDTIFHFRLDGAANQDDIEVISDSISHLQNMYKWFVIVDFPENENGISFLAAVQANPFDHDSGFIYIVGTDKGEKRQAFILREDYMSKEEVEELCCNYSIGNMDCWNELELTSEPGEPVMQFKYVSSVRFDPMTMRPTLPSDEFAVLRPCIAFEMDDVKDAVEHMSWWTVEEYGDSKYGHDLYVWDDGRRSLLKCRNCGGWCLYQHSTYRNDDDWGKDDHYEDFFPISGPWEADELNEKYNGYDIERAFSGRYLIRDNGKYHLSKK